MSAGGSRALRALRVVVPVAAIVGIVASIRPIGRPGVSQARATDVCAVRDSSGDPRTAAARGSLFCMDLVPIPELSALAGMIELRSAATPFGIDVTRDGHHRYALIATIDSLPPASSLGDFHAYVAWATTISMDTVVRLGVVRRGRSELGTITWDHFRILVTAERDSTVTARSGRLVMRGTSPSARLMAHRDMTRSGPFGGAPTPVARADSVGAHHHQGAWPMPPMDPRLPPMAGMEGLAPDVAPFLPRVADVERIPFARPREMLTVRSGDTIRLEAGFVRRRVAGKTFVMYAFNGQNPGPLIQVSQAARIFVDFRNGIDQPSTIHWHGIRLDNRFDGVAHVTQDPVPPGGRFLYEVRYPDAGIYWYHPHDHREDVQQDLGLAGNLLVEPTSSSAYGRAHRTEVLMLDDLLVGETGLVPFGTEAPTHALMGRFGNVLLVNGDLRYSLAARAGEVVRFHLTNVANTRVFNVSFGGAPLKVVGSDAGRFEREEWVESVILAPAERYTVDVRFERGGAYVLTNRIRALNHLWGTFFTEVDTLGEVNVASGAASPDLEAEFRTLRVNDDVVRDVRGHAAHFDRPPDHELVLSMRARDLPPAIEAMGMGFPVPIDWNDALGMMNWATTGKQITWILRDARTGRENMDVQWQFRRGDRVRLRIVNDPGVFHAMAHPIHVHGQRLLVLSRNGVATRNHVWKDTGLIQAGETVELLVEMSNPGRWMLHCHIAEHLGAGMMTVFVVE
jgi:suppressor of ftsI